MHGLRDIRVLDFSTGIAGPYCTKLLADAGADVIKVEREEGDPLRGWSATGADLRGADAALFRFLTQNKRGVRGELGDSELRDLVAGADLVVESGEPDAAAVRALRERDPGLVVLSISPFGRAGPWADRPWSEFTIQAECGSIGTRGLAGREPFQAGGRITEWVAGTYAAVGGLAAVWRAQHGGHGEWVDFSILEVMSIAGSNYMDLVARLLGQSELVGLPQSVETPSIEPTVDGYVGFCTNTRQQFSDFLLLIERPDLRDDEVLAQVPGRMARFDEWNEIVHAWTKRHTTAEILERASLLRIPVAPINNGETVRQHEQLAARGVFLRDATDSFVHPRAPYRITGGTTEGITGGATGAITRGSDDAPDAAAPRFRPAPRLGQHDGRIEPRSRPRRVSPGAPELPLAGLRILDMTAWWAGPSATHMLAALGAEVIHLESTSRPDGMRMVGGLMAGRFDAWWECSQFFLAANTNKRGLTLDLRDPRGLDLCKSLISKCDAVVENFTPRVIEGFGLDWPNVHALNPQTILVRMPAFGLSGPWRDHTGFAQTMEQMTGLAWLTGHRDDQPRIQRGPCDPLAGMHAAFALLVALAEREARGEGVQVECTMVEGALNAAAEQLIEWSAYGNLMRRDGNRAPEAAPQGLYPCSGHNAFDPQWLALSVASDRQWEALCSLLGRPAWSREPALATLRGRRAAHDAIDEQLRPWFAARERAPLVEQLLAAGVPAAPVADPRALSRNPQMATRGFYEEVDHPVVGTHPLPTLPFRYESVARWTRTPAPTLGQHNRELLGELLGVGEGELTALEADGVVGSLPRGV